MSGDARRSRVGVGPRAAEQRMGHWLAWRLAYACRGARHGVLRRAFAGGLCCVALLAASRAAPAFTFSDGTTTRCFAAAEPVAEYDATPHDPLVVQGHAGRTERNGPGYRITWNAAVLSTLPPELHDLLFFHECAHASVPTLDEVLANCVGLKTMRAAGRAGFAVEARLEAFYGRYSEYWQKTLACANAPEPPASAPAAH